MGALGRACSFCSLHQLLIFSLLVYIYKKKKHYFFRRMNSRVKRHAVCEVQFIYYYNSQMSDGTSGRQRNVKTV